jgi:hypothetical protein
MGRLLHYIFVSLIVSSEFIIGRGYDLQKVISLLQKSVEGSVLG